MSISRRKFLGWLGAAGFGSALGNTAGAASNKHFDGYPNSNGVLFDNTRCIGCRSCVGVCPFGAMGFNTIDKQVFKCDLCDGDPQCVRFCEVKAVDFVDAEEVCLLKTRDAAERVSAAGKSASALETQL